MTKFFYAQLPSRSVVSLTGEDAADFLNNLITVNMELVSKSRAGYGGLLTPQGKILFDFFVTPTEGGFDFDCAKSLSADFAKRLMFYRLRAKLEIVDHGDDLCVWALWGDGVPDDLGHEDPRAPLAGRRVITGEPFAPEDGTLSDEQAYHSHRIALGLADTDGDIGTSELFPHEANFDQFGGVDFKKGCYVGQEVVSRMHHRGTARKRIVTVDAENSLQAGADILGGERKIGTLLSSSGSSALALIRIDRAQETIDQGGALTADGQPIALRKQDWAHFDMPQAAD
ncbi:MAG: YgfZ/GcvT domain-containing protein [Hyphomicrobiales bacterium]